ncbi:DUF6273 domain-containing protein [Acutalibacter caecimuris]|uniref:DUF6273 domain-containing protein n=1 Tax=Acutalibacter caecimuris TaxID=3093657 RepID=UPI002AC949C8|nr:DUF6273 domain-containing protein [Acutalibacter sp. M00118]
MAELKTMYPAQPNTPETTLAGALTTSDTSVTVLDGSILPDAPNILTIGADTTTAETVLMTAKAGNVLTIERGYDGTTPRSWTKGDIIGRYFTAADQTAVQENIKALDTGKTAVSGGTDVALYDNKYGPDSSWAAPGAGYFVMNASNTNAGGWNSSQMRTGICGTSLTSYAGTILGVIPSDLRSNLKSVTKYTDNTGNASTAQANVTATTDYFFLLSEYEVFGTITYANTYEANKQAQYDYYKAGNSKVKYKYNATGIAVSWWLRSPRRRGSDGFVIVNTGGTVNYYNAYYSLAFTPGFCV